MSQKEQDRFSAHAAGLDLVPAQIALVASSGLIVHTNRAWDDFARANGYRGPGFVGQNYLELCACSTGAESEQADFFGEGLRRILSGEIDRFEVVYPCHAPGELRWFKAVIQPLSPAPVA